MKNLLLLLFIARITIPMGLKVTYDNVEKVDYMSEGFNYRLKLTDGRTVYAPMMFTVIEEVK